MIECNKETLTDSKYKGKQGRTWWCDSRKGFVEEVRHERGLEEINLLPYDSTTNASCLCFTAANNAWEIPFS